MMAVKSTLLLLVLVVIFAELPGSISFTFTKMYGGKTLVEFYRNRTKMSELRWEWTLAAGEVMAPLKIRRYLQGSQSSTGVVLATYTSAKTVTDATKYNFNVVYGQKGYATFSIKDLTNQGNNADGKTVDLMEQGAIYIYMIELDVETSTTVIEYTDKVNLIMRKIPVIKTYPRNQTVSGGGSVTFECVVEGKPTPTVKWEKIGSSKAFSDGPKLTLTDIDASKIGVYRCTAKSVGIAQNASATAFVQLSTCGSGCTSSGELGIEFPDLVYSYEYGNERYTKYKKLKNKIETECLTEYALKGKPIYKCEVLRCRKGSVVAVVELAYPNANNPDPKQPLLQAINDGNFAGYKVKPGFVSPTSPPTEKPASTLSTQKTSSVETPGSGQRSTESGISKGGIIALVVVFSIIFIVIIVVIIVCMLKRKKPSGASKPYKEDGRTYDKPTTTVPLKSQPFDPMYDDPNENRKEVVYADLNFQDRYPNGGGPPPQYTPSSNYAEVRPNQQDDSQVEWDKSVKDEMWI